MSTITFSVTATITQFLLEATQKQSTFEQWVPKGYDAYIIELTMAYSPFGATYVDLFENVNEVISYEAKEHWKDYVSCYYRQLWAKVRSGIGPSQDLMGLWDHVRNRNIQPVYTKNPEALDQPCVDINKQLHHERDLAVEKIQPKMSFPKSDKKVIAVGAFPAEYWDIFPALHWFRFDYARFADALRKQKQGLAIIGICGSESLKLQKIPAECRAVCYQQSVLVDIKKKDHLIPFSGDYPTLVSRIKEQKPGTPLVPEGEPYSGYNNRYWVRQEYSVDEPVWRNGNIVFCDGWVLPQYLIRDGYLEVN
ncbi:MAG: hypothetical protein A4E35_02323 [Methanoregula sp. PtaU1.Bin051]|nr:MAG: hypothetical protein A4E35_02323 [Methanoregula sp. PtaU1.Bin051]